MAGKIIRGARGRGGVKLTAAAAAAMLSFAACGSERPAPSSGVSNAGSSGGAGGPFADAGTRTLPGCGAKDDGSFCDCVDTPLFADPPNIYFVLDRSGSMAEDNKWDQVRVVVAQILRGLGPRANFGATVFPGFEEASCAPAKEVLALRPGDPPGIDGPTTRSLLRSTAGTPSGGTPTAEALRSVRERLLGAPGKTFVILATDGGPNCSVLTSCGVEQCMPNIENQENCPRNGPMNCCAPPEGYREACLDASATNAAVAALRARGIPVYVVGLPGTATYGALLDQLATTGGTALAGSPQYYRVEKSSTALLGALKKIAAKIVATCEFKLKEAPAAPDRVNVYLDEVAVPKDPVNGWKLDGGTVTLLGSTCSRVLSGDVLDVRIIAGCPTLEPR